MANLEFYKNNLKLENILMIAIIVFSFSLFPTQNADAVTTITWSSPSGYPINEGDALGLSAPITFIVSNTDLSGNSIIDTIDVLITSSTGDSTTLTLTETIDNGIFTNTNLIFTHGEAEFETTDTTTVTIQDNCTSGTGNCDPNVIETLIGGSGSGAFVASNSDPSGIFIDLTETGPNTGLFERTLSFSTTSSDASSATILVAQGDVISVVDEFTSAYVNGLIVPSPGGIGSISAEIGGAVTASYNGISEPVNVLDDGAPGRGGGGLIRPGMVLDAIGFLLGGCQSDCMAPTLGVTKYGNRLVDGGFTYNNQTVDVQLFYTPYPLIMVNIGQENIAVLKIYENFGTQNIAHVELGFGLGKGERINESKAIIEWDRDFSGIETISIYDPENALQDVKVKVEEGNCKSNSFDTCLIIIFIHTFREALEFNTVGTYVWDLKRNGWQNYYNDGIEIVGESMNPAKKINVIDPKGYPTTITLSDKNTGIDENDRLWQKNGKMWIMESKLPKKIIDKETMHGIDRNNNMFMTYKKEQNLLAEEKLEQILLGKIISNEDFGKNNNNNILWSFDEEVYKKELEQKIQNEVEKAEKLFKKLFKIKHKH